MAEISNQEYQHLVSEISIETNSAATIPKAFCIGGGICLLGEILRQIILSSGLSAERAGTLVSVVLVFCSALLTVLGCYKKIAKHGGARTLVPITCFANAVTSAAVESRTEGFVLGIGTKNYTSAGPVILYGTAASAVYGLIYWALQQL